MKISRHASHKVKANAAKLFFDLSEDLAILVFPDRMYCSRSEIQVMPYHNYYVHLDMPSSFVSTIPHSGTQGDQTNSNEHYGIVPHTIPRLRSEIAASWLSENTGRFLWNQFV